MKKQILSFTLVLFSLVSFAQTTYEKVMKEKIAKIEAVQTAEEFQALANDFQRIADKEKGKWQPAYYAAYSYIQKGRSQMREGKTDGLDDAADRAQKYVDEAQNVEKNAEIMLLQKMIYSLKMMVNPMERFMTFGTKAAEQLTMAEKRDSNNPRIALIKAEDIYFTPEQYGGSKEKGIELFKQALEKFNSYQPKSDLDPNWGKSEAEYFIKQASK